MKFDKRIVDYMKANPKTANVFIHKDGTYFFNQPTITSTEKVTEGDKEKTVKKFKADKSFEEYSREEVLKGGAAESAEGDGKSKKDEKKSAEGDGK